MIKHGTAYYTTSVSLRRLFEIFSVEMVNRQAFPYNFSE